jgi:parallel beta-helix repeat protein
MKKAVSGIILTLLILTSMFTLALNIQPIRAWSGIVYIRADGSIDPPDAPIATVDKVTYSLSDNINGSIVVQRVNIVIDGRGYKLQGVEAYWHIGGLSIGVDLSRMSNVTIKNLTIKSFHYGIYLNRSSSNSISGNNIITWGTGIYLWESSSNGITGNNITSGESVHIAYSSNNVIEGNNIISSFCGIFLGPSSSENVIRGNKFQGGGLYVHASYRNVVMDNIVNDKPLVYLEWASNITVVEAGQVILVNCQYIQVKNLNLSNTICGLQLRGTSHVLISNNNIANNHIGMDLCTSSNNIISGNTVTNNGNNICLEYFSNNNIISRNNLTNSMGCNIYLCYSDSNNICENSIANNHCGISLCYSSGNKIYHNNFIENELQIYAGPSCKNCWDDGYPSGGNYWSDYTGVDYCSGPYQNMTGSDGIGDTPYVIDEYNVDRYPLMYPWTPVLTATLDIHPQALNLQSGGRWVTAYIELPEGYNVSDINRTTVLLNGTIPIDPFWVNKTIESVIGDYDNDTIPDLMVKFDRASVSSYILSKNITYGNVTLTMTGMIADMPFEGSCVIRVRMPGDVDCNGVVNILDIVQIAKAYGSNIKSRSWNPAADENEDGKIDIFDLVTAARNYGKTYK